MKILSIGGTRPQFIKMAVMVRAFADYNLKHDGDIEHTLLHTGQHYDPMMSEIFFEELRLPKPKVLLGIQNGRPGMQTAAMLASIEAELVTEPPDAVLIYGDTNSTLAAALAATKLHMPLIHLEAGLRSFNRRMQEETNRVVSDHVSDLLLCPTQSAIMQLKHEGLGGRAVLVGDVMLDSVLHFSRSETKSKRAANLGLTNRPYALATIHRAETTDDVRKLSSVFRALERLQMPVVLPLHPRLKHLLGDDGTRMLAHSSHIHLVEPVGYLEMLRLEQQASLILTDSGGVQKEAYFLAVPCLTMRDETEWTETLQGGWNTVVGTATKAITAAVDMVMRKKDCGAFEPRDLSTFGDGCAGSRSVTKIASFLEALRCAQC